MLVNLTMFRRVAVFHAVLIVVSGMVDVRLLNSRYTGLPFECYDYPSAMPLRSYDTGWRLPRNVAMLDITTPKYWPPSTQKFNVIKRRSDVQWNRDDIVKEHAKLVQDINSLRQVMYVAPLVEESDYEDSIFPEIETSSTTTARPPTKKSSRPNKTGIPILLLGGGSHRHSSKTPLKNPKKTISLIGSSFPIAKHPYPFVMAASSPVRICMSSPLTYSSVQSTPPPSLWERLVKAIIPR